MNAANPIKGLTKAQVRQILSGDITDWKTVGGKPGAISVFTRTAHPAPTWNCRRAHVAAFLPPPARPAKIITGNEQIAAQVAKNPHGIGCVSLASAIRPKDRPFRWTVSCRAKKAVRSMKYPYSRQAYLYDQGCQRRGGTSSPSQSVCGPRDSRSRIRALQIGKEGKEPARPDDPPGRQSRADSHIVCKRLPASDARIEHNPAGPTRIGRDQVALFTT